MGLILYILSIILSIIFTPIGIICGLINDFYKCTVKIGLNNANAKFKLIAGSIDQLGNVVCAELFNWTLIYADGYKFGNPDDKISYVIGVNKDFNKLMPIGKLLCQILLDCNDPLNT